MRRYAARMVGAKAVGRRTELSRAYVGGTHECAWPERMRRYAARMVGANAVDRWPEFSRAYAGGTHKGAQLGVRAGRYAGRAVGAKAVDRRTAHSPREVGRYA